jgi:hypothetical protein
MARPNRQAQEEKLLTEDEYAMVVSYIERLKTILGELGKVPYTNSVPPALKQIEASTIQILKAYEKLLAAAGEAVTRKDAEVVQAGRSAKALRAEIEQYRYALDSLLRQNRENGYIIDPRNSNDIGFFLHDLHLIEDGDFGIVFRQDNEYIGKVGFKRDGDRFRAYLADLQDRNNPMQPFDKILLEVNQETAQ